MSNVKDYLMCLMMCDVIRTGEKLRPLFIEKFLRGEEICFYKMRSLLNPTTIIKIANMEKKQPTRDSKGRFMKKENKKAFDYEGAYKQQKEVTADLQKESEYYKELAERMSSNYLNKCAEYGELKRELEIYKEYFPKMKKIAKLWKQKAELRLKGLLFYSDAVMVMEERLNWLEKSVPWYKRICLNRKKVEKFNALYDECKRLLDCAHKCFE